MTPNLVHRKTKSSGMSLPKIVLDEKVCMVEINVPLIGCLHYQMKLLKGITFKIYNINYISEGSVSYQHVLGTSTRM